MCFRSSSSAFYTLLRGMRVVEVAIFSGLTLGIGVNALAQSAVPQAATPQTIALQSAIPRSAKAAARSLSLKDGIHLYGEAPQPNQLGSTYMIFAVQGDRIQGAVYWPHSSFDCFQGTIQNQSLALELIDSYEQTRYTHAIALTQTGAIASRVEPETHNSTSNTPSTSIGLAGMNRFEQPSPNDLRILKACQTDVLNSAHHGGQPK